MIDKERQKDKTYVVSFSGGKDSTAMLLMLLEKGYPVDKIINVDTTKEFPQVYEHIEKVEKYIGRPIIKIKIDFDYWFFQREITCGKYKGKKGLGWMGALRRWCTNQKRLAFNHAILDLPFDSRTWKEAKGDMSNIITYIGIASDEQKRLNRNKDGRDLRYPLAEWSITEKDALQYCYSKGFDWGGLYAEGHRRLSCYCCSLQDLNSLYLTYKNHKDLWDKIKWLDEHNTRRQFKDSYTIPQLEEKFEKKLQLEQQTLSLLKE